jgi:hypothetical protein
MSAATPKQTHSESGSDDFLAWSNYRIVGRRHPRLDAVDAGAAIVFEVAWFC